MAFIPDNNDSFKPDDKGLLPTLVGGASRVLSAPSEMIGGAIKASREAAAGEFEAPKTGITVPGTKLGGRPGLDIGETFLPTLVGAARGLRERTPVMEELPAAVGVDPESAPGMAIGLVGEIATPDVLDVIKFGDIAKGVTSKFGKTLKETGEKLVVKSIRPSPSQLTKFTRKNWQGII